VLLLVVAVGLGPFAGVLGIALHTWGSAAKFLPIVCIARTSPGLFEPALPLGVDKLPAVLDEF
jgi:phosphonate transport system permease protein